MFKVNKICKQVLLPLCALTLQVSCTSDSSGDSTSLGSDSSASYVTTEAFFSMRYHFEFAAKDGQTIAVRPTSADPNETSVSGVLSVGGLETPVTLGFQERLLLRQVGTNSTQTVASGTPYDREKFVLIGRTGIMQIVFNDRGEATANIFAQLGLTITPDAEGVVPELPANSGLSISMDVYNQASPNAGVVQAVEAAEALGGVNASWQTATGTTDSVMSVWVNNEMLGGSFRALPQ